MSTYRARKEAANKSKFSSIKLLATSALTAAGLMMSSGAALADNSWGGLQGENISINTDDPNFTQVTATAENGIALARGEADIAYGDTVDVNANIFSVIDPNDINILGRLQSQTGAKIVLIANGSIHFGDGSSVDVGSLITTTGSISEDQLLNNAFGDYTIQNANSGSITIEAGAQITIAEGGLAAFVAPHVVNAGVINAKLGKVAFAAGEKVTIDLYGDGLFEVEVEGELADAYLENTGEINANGGVVQMSALAAKDVADNIINLDGVVDVSSATQVGGKIILSGGNKGNVNVTGKADASGTSGGSIDVTGQNITVASAAELNADGGKGEDQNGNGGRIDAIAREHMDFRGILSARGGNAGGNGGNAEISGLEYLGYQGFADLRAPSGETGTLLMDPEFAVIHSGILNNPLGQGYVLSAQAIANSMEAANIIVQADNFIDVGTKIDAYNTGNVVVDAILNGLVGAGDINLSTFDYNRIEQTGSFFGFPIFGLVNYTGTTAGNITLQSDTVNFNKDVIMGDGNLGVDGNTVNLDSRILDKDGSTALGEARLFSNAGIVNVLSNEALIQQGIYLSDDAGGATVNVAKGTYNENIIIDRALKLIGDDATIIGNGIDDAIKVLASNVNIDPFVIDAADANYGINASGVGAIGFTSDGNTFKNSARAGIYVEVDTPSVGITTIKNNTFEGSATRGVETGNLRGPGYELNILDNTIGTAGDEVRTGLDIGRVINAKVNVERGTINATGDAVYFREGTFNTSNVTLTDVVATGGDEALDVQGILREGSTFAITNGTFNGGANGVEFQRIDGDLTLANVTANGATRNGANFLPARGVGNPAITGNLTITGGSYTGNVDGIGSAVAGGNNIDGGNVTITGADITGTTGNGVSFGGLSNNANLRIDSNTITSALDGGKIDGDIDASEIQIAGNAINAGEDGIKVAGAITNSTVRTPQKFGGTEINAGSDGIVFEGDITGSTITTGGQSILATGGDAIRFDGVIDNSRVAVGISDVTDPTTSWTGGVHTGSESGIVFKDNVQNNSSVEITLGRTTNRAITGQNGDGIRFEGDVDASNVLMTSTAIEGQNGAGINFEGDIINASTINIAAQDIAPLPETGNTLADFFITPTGNTITGSTDGVSFANIESGSDVNIANNTITAGDDGIYVDGQTTGAGTTLNVLGNTINADDDGLDIDNVANGATVNIGGLGIGEGNEIFAGSGSFDDGIEFDAGVDSNVNIIANRISAGGDGILVTDQDPGAVTGVDNGATINITNNNIGSVAGDSIGKDGINFDDSITDGSTVNIAGNNIGRSGAYVGDDGIDIDSITDGATVNITNNPNNYARDNGIEVSGEINNATLTITGNNHGIHAGDHGIYVGGNVWFSAEVNIHDNIISANENNNGTGDGIRFDGDIYTADINIGDGNGNGLFNNPSNFIRGVDGIHFDGFVTNGADIDIDGNRIGYGRTSGGTVFTDRVNDDGIQFIGDIAGNANVSITDNYVRSSDDGVSFIGEVEDNARVLIGGVNDGNTIDARGTGIQFQDDIKENSLLTISYNEVDASGNGIEFNGNTSNHIDSGNPSEILIANNDVDGGQNGILFEGLASDARHDIVIRDNTQIIGRGGDGIRHEGGINDAEIAITNNERILGRLDGIHVEGFLYNDARLDITGNQNVQALLGDGIEVTDTGFTTGADVNINGNEVTRAGDNGIEVANVSGVDIFSNEVTNTGDDGIDVKNSSFAEIRFNQVGFTGDDGIDVENSAYVDVNDNIVSNTGDDGIDVENSFDADIRRNLIANVSGDGIELINSNYADIRENIVLLAGDDGIDLEDSNFVDIVNNAVGLVDANGIEVENSDNADIESNFVGGTGQNGIYVNPSDDVNIDSNIVLATLGDGIQVNGGENADVTNNLVLFTGDNGINVNNNTGDVNITDNTISLTFGDGIEATDNADGMIIADNEINFAADDGIDVEGSRNARIDDNTISDTGANGIEITDDSRGTRARDNTISNTGENGIFIEDSRSARANDNVIDNASASGIYFDNVNRGRANRNTISGSGENGIFIKDSSTNIQVEENTIAASLANGIEVENVNDIGILQNEITDSGTNGILVRDSSTDILVEENIITGSIISGIEVDNVDGIGILRNDITDSGVFGLLASGPTNGDVTLVGNTFTDNPTGARFESGNIDISDLTDPNSFINTDPAGTPVGLQFDEVGIPGSLTIVGNTLGGTIFSGFNNIGSFYARIENGTLLDTGTGEPIVIGGLNANFDGFVPASVSGILTFDQLVFLEDRLFDADDSLLNGRGQIFVGAVPGLNFEDFLREFGFGDFGTSGLNLRIASLPAVDGTSLAGIEPAAGGEGEGETAEDFASIEPAAGEEGEDAACLGDAIAAASAGVAANFTFGGTFEESLADASACQSGIQ